MIRPKKESIPKILKIKEYRNKKKLSFREIARIMRLGVKDVYRWYMYDEKKLSTPPVKKGLAPVGK